MGYYSEAEGGWVDSEDSGDSPAEVTETYDIRGNLVSSVETPITDPLAPGDKSDSRHVYVGRDSRGDVWQIFDGQNVIEWAVTPGAASGAIIAGTAANLGPPSSASIAQAVSGPGDKVPDNPAHVYVGTDDQGDIYKLVENGGSVTTWHVKINDDSRNAIPGTITISDPATPASTSPKPSGDGVNTAAITNNAGRVQGDAAHVYDGSADGYDLWHLVDAGGNTIRWKVKMGDDSRNIVAGTVSQTAGSSVKVTTTKIGVPGETVVTAAPNDALSSAGPPIQSNSRHIYVGRIGDRDYWQIFDGTNVLEWQTKAGDESGFPISGTTKNLGPPSAMTKAQNDGTAVQPPAAPVTKITATDTPLVTEGTKNIVVIGLAAAGFALKLF